MSTSGFVLAPLTPPCSPNIYTTVLSACLPCYVGRGFRPARNAQVRKYFLRRPKESSALGALHHNPTPDRLLSPPLPLGDSRRWRRPKRPRYPRPRTAKLAARLCPVSHLARPKHPPEASSALRHGLAPDLSSFAEGRLHSTRLSAVLQTREAPFPQQCNRADNRYTEESSDWEITREQAIGCIPFSTLESGRPSQVHSLPSIRTAHVASTAGNHATERELRGKAGHIQQFTPACLQAPLRTPYIHIYTDADSGSAAHWGGEPTESGTEPLIFLALAPVLDDG